MQPPKAPEGCGRCAQERSPRTGPRRRAQRQLPGLHSAWSAAPSPAAAPGRPQLWDGASPRTAAPVRLSVRPLGWRRQRGGGGLVSQPAARRSPAMAAKVTVTSWPPALPSGRELPCQRPPPRVRRAHGEQPAGWRPCPARHRQRGRLAAPRAVDMARLCCLCHLLAGAGRCSRRLAASSSSRRRREHRWRRLARVRARQGVSRKQSVFLGSGFAVGLHPHHGMRLH